MSDLDPFQRMLLGEFVPEEEIRRWLALTNRTRPYPCSKMIWFSTPTQSRHWFDIQFAATPPPTDSGAQTKD